jgi:hypothetical protein
LGASTLDVGRWIPVLIAFFGLCRPASAQPQVLAEPVLEGRAFLGDSALTSGTVVLHLVGEATQGEIDSVQVSRDGSFAFRLPSVPDPRRSEVYFASVRHAGILYFGSAISLPVQLDSLYEIHAYDTLVVSPGGAAVPVEARNVFLEEDSSGWQVTDLIQLRNDEDRTLVAPENGVVWRYPLPPTAQDPTMSDATLAATSWTFEDGDVVVRAPLPPGERLFVVRYAVPGPFLEIPLPGVTEGIDVLVKEPAPPLEVPGLTVAQPVELEPGSTYRRFSGAETRDAVVRLVEGEVPRTVPPGWLALLLALVLGSAGVWIVQRPALERPTPLPRRSRRALLVEVAQLDEAFEATPSPTPEERGAYEVRRRGLLRQLHSTE